MVVSDDAEGVLLSDVIDFYIQLHILGNVMFLAKSEFHRREGY